MLYISLTFAANRQNGPVGFGLANRSYRILTAKKKEEKLVHRVCSAWSGSGVPPSSLVTIGSQSRNACVAGAARSSKRWACTRDGRRLLRFASLNVDTLLQCGRLALITDELKRFRVDIAAVQETRWMETGLLDSDGFHIVRSGQSNRRGQEGVALFVRDGLKGCIVSSKPCGGRLLLVRFRLPSRQHLSVVVCYAPTEEAAVETTEEFYQQLSCLVSSVSVRDALIVLGDFNARVGADSSGWPHVLGCFGVGQLSPNGSQLLDFCVANELAVMGTWFRHKDIHKFTWKHPDGQHVSQIDHVLCRQSRRSEVQDVRVYRDANISTQAESGHYLLLAKVKFRLCRARGSVLLPKFDLERLKAPEVARSFECTVHAKLQHQLLQSSCVVEEEWAAFVAGVSSAADAVVGVAKGGPARASWISPGTRELVAVKRKLREKLLHGGNDVCRAQLRDVCKAVRSSCYRDKEAWWQRKALELEDAARHGRSREQYSLLKNLSRPPGRLIPVVRDSSGKVLLDSPDEVLERWTEHFKFVLGALESAAGAGGSSNWRDCLGPEDSLPLSEEQLFLASAPSLDEVRSAVKQSASGKAAGADRLAVELLRSESCIRWLHHVISLVWKSSDGCPQAWKDGLIIPLYKGKGPADLCDNFRGITLLSVPGKIYARLLQRRLLAFAERRVSETQNGFRPGRGCTDAIFTVRRLMEMSQDGGVQLWAAFIDFTKAYDSVRRDSLWSALRAMGAPRLFVERIAEMHHPTHVRVRLGSLFGTQFQTTLGLRQGCVLAPILFNLYLDWLMSKVDPGGGVPVAVVEHGSRLQRPNSFREPAQRVVPVKDVRFADDIALLALDRAGLERSLADVGTACAAGNLSVSLKKTEVLVVGGDGSEDSVQYQGSILKSVSDFVYLGSSLSRSCHVHVEIGRRLALARTKFQSLKTVLWKRKEVSLCTKVRVFRATVLSRLLYGAECWPLTAADLARLEGFQSNCLRRILRVSWMKKVTNQEVRERCGMTTLDSVLRQRRMQWLGHVQRMGDERLPKVALWGRLEGCQRKAGGRRRRVVDVFTADLRAAGVEATWKELCSDRVGWRKHFRPTAVVTSREAARYSRKRPELCSSVVPGVVALRPQGVRASVAERAGMLVVCSRGGCSMRFSREADEKRHCCSSVRAKRTRTSSSSQYGSTGPAASSWSLSTPSERPR